jgi:hypothetical protein
MRVSCCNINKLRLRACPSCTVLFPNFREVSVKGCLIDFFFRCDPVPGVQVCGGQLCNGQIRENFQGKPYLGNGHSPLMS